MTTTGHDGADTTRHGDTDAARHDGADTTRHDSADTTRHDGTDTTRHEVTDARPAPDPDSGLLSPVRAGTPVEAPVGDTAWLQAMLDAEAALARAQAH